MRRASVPTEIFWPIVEETLERHSVTECAVEFVSRRCQINNSTLLKATKRPDFDFYMADLILCSLNVVEQWHVEPLAEFYWSVDLTLDQCHSPVCGRDLPMYSGDANQRYCNSKCKQDGEIARQRERYHARQAA